MRNLSEKKHERVSGVLLPVASLKSDFGIGSLGTPAHSFAKLLADAGQRLWQVLPLTIPDFVNSPYASPSAFAGNQLLIDPMRLVDEGLLYKSEVVGYCRAGFERIDYKYAIETKDKLLRLAYDRFQARGIPADYTRFIDREAGWINDFALFWALKRHFGGKPYWEWDDDARDRKRAVSRYTRTMLPEIGYVRFCQYIFDRQLQELRAKLSQLGIMLVGDIPFYVARDSADVWAHPELFLLDSEGRPKLVAGVPPDFFSKTGQLWGNPIYDWAVMKDNGYKWWMSRLARCGRLYDITRLDHFRAFDSYYTISAGASDAVNGRWRRGVGREFFDIQKRRLPKLRMIAEDLGDVTRSVLALRDYAGLPGMKILQFAFDSDADNQFLPHNYTPDSVAYLGTHDNDTSAGWWHSLDDETRQKAADYLGIATFDGARQAVRRMMSALSASVADSVIFTMQDLRVEGSDKRINTPSKTGCWEYMVEPRAEDLVYLEKITRLYGRAPKPRGGDTEQNRAQSHTQDTERDLKVEYESANKSQNERDCV